MPDTIQPVANKKMSVGLGEAVQRLLTVEMRLMNGFTSVENEDLAQRQLILQALNTTKLDLGFDCDDDNVPDTADIFEKAAQTSCCRIVVDAPKQRRAKTQPAKAVAPQEAPKADTEPAPSEDDSSKKKKSGFFGTLFGSNE